MIRSVYWSIIRILEVALEHGNYPSNTCQQRGSEPITGISRGFMYVNFGAAPDLPARDPDLHFYWLIHEALDGLQIFMRIA